MAEMFPSFARKREAINHAVLTKALTAVRKYVQALPEAERERFFCLVADVACVLAWGAGRRDWVSLMAVTTRVKEESFGDVIRKMGLAESLETALWAAMRAHPHGLFRNALGLVAIHLHLGTAWVHREVLKSRDTAGAMILDAFDVAELSPSRPADLEPEDFQVGAWTDGGPLFTALRDDIFIRSMDPETPLTERGACNTALRDAFDIDPLGGGRAGSPCFDLSLRFTQEIGVKGALSEATKLFGDDIAKQALARMGVPEAGKALVSQPKALSVASEIWGERLEKGLEPKVGGDCAQELRRRCHMALTYGRATTPAFILLAMVSENRWLILAGTESAAPSTALDAFLDAGGSWPSLLPPAGVSVRSVDQSADPKEGEILGRNQWTGRDFKWYWVAAIIALMVYGWAVSVGLF